MSNCRLSEIISTVYISLLCLTLLTHFCTANDLRLGVPAGARECFYEEIAKGTHFDVQFQVLSGGELDINFQVQGPNFQAIISDFKQKGQQYKLEAKLDGTHTFCLDNSFSLVSRKLVYFELYFRAATTVTIEPPLVVGGTQETVFDMRVQDFKRVADSVGHHLQKSRDMQRDWNLIESRHRSVQEYNFERVNFWSAVQVFVMLCASVTNVILIRSLFDDRRRRGVKSPTKQQT